MYLNPFDVFDDMDLYSSFYFWLAGIVDLHDAIWRWQCWSSIQPKGPTAPLMQLIIMLWYCYTFLLPSPCDLWGHVFAKRAAQTSREYDFHWPICTTAGDKVEDPTSDKINPYTPTMTFVDSLAQPQCWWVVYSLLLVLAWLLVCCVMQVH